MADITMCANGATCPVKNNCYRYTAIASRMQSYANYNKYKGAECKDYWPLKELPND